MPLFIKTYFFHLVIEKLGAKKGKSDDADFLQMIMNHLEEKKAPHIECGPRCGGSRPTALLQCFQGDVGAKMLAAIADVFRGRIRFGAGFGNVPANPCHPEQAPAVGDNLAVLG